MAGANESMLIGMGVCAAGLFPFTLILRHSALVAEAVLLVPCLSWAVLRRIGRRSDRLSRPALDPTARGILAAVLLVAGGFTALNFRYTYLWDGFMIWATKARLLARYGELTRDWLPPRGAFAPRQLPQPALLSV